MCWFDTPCELKGYMRPLAHLISTMTRQYWDPHC